MPSASSTVTESAAVPEPLSPVLTWLAEHPEVSDPETLSPQLSEMLAEGLPPRVQLQALEALLSRLQGAAGVDARLARFIGVKTPLSNALYRQASALLNLLDDAAQGFASVFERLHSHATQEEQALCLERELFFLYKHLCLCCLLRRPLGMGVWERLHDACQRSRFAGQMSPLVHYAKALLLTSAQPASLTSRELAAIVYYLQRHESLLASAFSANAPEHVDAAFWIPVGQDLRPFPLLRRAPPEGAGVLFFSCLSLVEKLAEDIRALANGQGGVLPLSPRVGRKLLQRLADCWGKPRLRRFPRHRKAYRGVLCVGLEALRQNLAQLPLSAGGATTHWMQINESPDGHGLMHLFGDVDEVRVGDLVAWQPNLWANREVKTSAMPQIGVIRWLLSETPEHLEIGLQMLANGGEAAILIAASDPGREIPALLLPPTPPRATASLVMAMEDADSDAADATGRVFRLLVGNARPRTIRLGVPREQTQHIQIFSFFDHVTNLPVTV